MKRCGSCLTMNGNRFQRCQACAARLPKTREPEDAGQVQACVRCGEVLSVESFYFVSRGLGSRRRQCKNCMSEIKAAQKDPSWLPTCAQCGRERPRSGPGRRLCQECFDAKYDAEARRDNGAHLLALRPCSACGSRRLRSDHVKGTSLCHVCRSVPQSRRMRLKTYFNMTPREYVDLLRAQGDGCAICHRHVDKGSPLHVDHRHKKPSIIRGIVCGSCNTILGLARDNADRLRSAAAYLEKPPAQEMFPGRTSTSDGNRDSWSSFGFGRRVA